MLELITGNRNYSSWSMRPWVLLRQAGIAFEDTVVRFDSFDADSDFKRRVGAVNPAAKVPVLIDHAAGGLVVWDSLAICEYLAEAYPEKNLWPREAAARAHARSVCAEMHSGFAALRTHCGMNIEAVLPEVGARLLREQPALRADVQRVVNLFAELLGRRGGPLLFGDFTIADAYFAPVAMRFKTYGLPAPAPVAAYLQRVRELPGVRAWTEQALAEHDFLAFEEPYREAPPGSAR